jgi:hypothetical protein
MDWTRIVEIAAAVYGILALIVKICPTLKKGWLLEIIKILAKITNNQTDDEAARASTTVTPK